VFQKKRWSFDSEVMGNSPDGSVQYLRMPTGLESTERRGAFRLATSIKPSSLYRLIIDKDAMPDDEDANVAGIVVDLSEGGLCLSSSARIERGERLGIQASLGEGIEFTARMQVTMVDNPSEGQRNRRIHCQFTDISRGDKDRVAKFLIRRQLEMRRRGQI
jgi:c-di-GMP-binding flagellar brake protein YcgR